MKSPDIPQRALWGLGFAACDAVLRAFALGLSPPSWLWGLPAGFTTGVVFAQLASYLPDRAQRHVVSVGALALLFFHAFVYRFEAVLGRFPNASQAVYLSEIGPAWSSVESESPLPTLLILIACAVALAVAWRKLRGLEVPRAAERALSVITVAGVVFSAAVHVFDVFDGRAFWATRVPAVWVAQSAFGHRPPKLLREEEVRAVYAGMRQPAPPEVSLEAPLCSGPPRQGPPNGRSVIVVIVESLGRETMLAAPGGKVVVPHARQIAKDGVWFDRIMSAGTGSDQALPALLAGVPPLTRRTLVQRPLPRFRGIAQDLDAAGYRTLYVHGGDLSFLGQREFLRAVGFEEFLELDARIDAMVGWGVPDDVMFERFRDTLETSAAKREPYFAVFATLSSHHPYAFPPGLDLAFGGKTTIDSFHSLAHYTDEHLGTFYSWYRANEYARGTYLIVIGDHVAQAHNVEADQRGEPLAFEIPMIVVGQGIEPGEKPNEALGSQSDLSPTVRGLLGMPEGECELGSDLFASDFPTDRLVGGSDVLDPRIYTVRTPEGNYVRNLERGVFLDQPEDDSRAGEVRAFSQAMYSLTLWLLRNDAFVAKSGEKTEARPPLGPVEAPSTISRSASETEFALARVALTRDDQLVVLSTDGQRERFGGGASQKTLAELREIEGFDKIETLDAALSDRQTPLFLHAQATQFWDHDGRLAHALAGLALQDEPARYHLHSSSPELVSSLRNFCEACPVGWRVPFVPDEPDIVLSTATELGVDFVIIGEDGLDLAQEIRQRGIAVYVWGDSEGVEVDGVVGE